MGESRWASRTKDIVALLGLLVLNVAVVYPLFQGEYTKYMGSIEAGYISGTKFIVDHFPHLSWNPLWYLGYPFHLFYTPFLPYLIAAINSITAISIGSAYRLVVGSLYVLGPVTFFLFVRQLTRRRFTAFIAALSFSLLPSVAYLIGEVRSVASGFGYAPWRLVVLSLFGEGPHNSGLAFTPLAALFFLRLLKRPCLGNYILTAIMTSLVALIDLAALYGLAVILAVILLGEIVAGDPLKKLATTFYGALLTYGLCAFWYNLSFIRAPFAYIAAGGGDFTFGALAPLLVIGLPIIGGIVLAFSGREELQPLLVVAPWLLVFSVIEAGWYYLEISLSPQPYRYIPELDMAFCMLLAIAVTWATDRLAARGLPNALARPIGMTVVTALLISLPLPFLRQAWQIVSPNSTIEETPEYRMAKFLEGQVVEERVYVTGTNAFWLNVFTRVVQLRGGMDQGATNPWWAHVTYQINKGEDGELAVLWAKALGLRYIVVNYPDSTVDYKDYQHPDKFEGLLPEVYRVRGDVVFEVPNCPTEYVRPVYAEKLKSLSPIQDALDVENLRAYLSVVEEELPRSTVDYTWENNDHLVIQAKLEEGAALLVRMTYDSGWRASIDGQGVDIKRDPLSFMVIKPDEPGEYLIHLLHGRVWDEWLGYGVTGVTLLALFIVGIGTLLKKGSK